MNTLFNFCGIALGAKAVEHGVRKFYWNVHSDTTYDAKSITNTTIVTLVGVLAVYYNVKKILE